MHEVVVLPGQNRSSVVITQASVSQFDHIRTSLNLEVSSSEVSLHVDCVTLRSVVTMANINGADATEELAGMTSDDILRGSRLLDSEIRVLKSANTALPAGESDSTPIKSECGIPVDEGSQPFRSETSGDLGSLEREQDVETGEKMDAQVSQIRPTKSSNEDRTREVEVGVVKPSSNGLISWQQEKPGEKSPESLVNITESTSTVDTSARENLPEKTAKRGTEVECSPEKPAKRKRKNDIMFSVPDTVEAVLGSTAEIIIVLAGMAQMRAGRPLTSLERDLAAVACQNIGSLVSKVAPSALVSKEALERMVRDLDLKRMAQTRKEDQARAKALAEAEALAKEKAAKAEAITKLKAEELARMKAESEERLQQAASKAAADVVAKSPPKDVKFSDVLPPPAMTPGQPTQALPPHVEPKISSPTPVASSNIQIQIAAQACDVYKPPDVPEKSEFDNSPSQQSSKTSLGKPPKVRNRIKKDLAAPNLLSPEFLEYIQSQVPEPQKTQLTHKQLCLAVQQFIQEQTPHPSQTLQAIPPSYINTPTPCQLCKSVAKDTGTVVVCDSCDQLFHVKCVQPNNHTKGVPKGDWHCPQCLSGGRSYREKYGLYRRGSVNGVKLWAPHDASEDNDGLISDSGTGSSGRQSGLDYNLKMPSKLTVDVETGSHMIKDDRSVANYGGSPHLIVHLVNEPSPRTVDAVQKSSPPRVGGDTMWGSLASGSQLKLTSRPQSGDSRTMTEEDGSARPRSRENEGDVSDCVRRASGSQVETVEGSVEQGSVDIPSNLPGQQVEVPLIMEWVGESTRMVEGKTYYGSCRVGAQTYHLSDYALFRPETPDVPPYIARLQVLWEDLSTSHKWVRVSWCYYPNDIPLTMGRPGRAEPDEVYESNHCDNNLVGSIQGPCLVLSPIKYRKELERRNELQKRGGIREALPPVFLSRWLYDAPKGIFKPVTE